MPQFLENIKETWANQPKGIKIAFVIAVLAVAGIAFYELRRGQSSAAAGTSPVPDTGTSAAGMQSPYSQVPTSSGQGSVPVVPGGVTPIFDAAGNLIGWNQGGATVQPPAPGPVTQPPTNVVPCPPGSHNCKHRPTALCCCDDPKKHFAGTKCV